MATISRIARRQHGVITLAQLYAAGSSRAAVRHLVATGRLWRVHIGVYALEGPLSAEGEAYAAALACRGAISTLSAAFLTGAVDARPLRPHVTVIGRSGARGPKGVVLHHARTLETTTHNHIPITTPAQTAIDCAPLLSDRNLKELLRRSEHDGLDLRTLDRPRIPANLRRLLDHYVIGSGLTANQLEACFYEICARAGLPLPEIQAWFPGRRRVDFVWHEQRLIAETDGRRAHDGFIASTDDRARDRAHAIGGYTTLRFTWAEVEATTVVAEDLVAFFNRGSAGGER